MRLKSIDVAREGAATKITLLHADEYNAMMVYDLIEKHMRAGYVKLELTPRLCQVSFTDG
jgi:hypothetical protein